MESRNQQPVSGMSAGSTSVALRNTLPDALKCRLRSGPLSPEQLADILDEPHTRRAWWLDLHTSDDLRAGTTISELDAAVAKACHVFGYCALCGEPAGQSHSSECPRANRQNGSNGQPAAAPISFVSERCACNGPGCPDCSAVLTMPVCACSQPVASLRPFDWQCAKCKGVIPSPYLTDEQRCDYLEAL